MDGKLNKVFCACKYEPEVDLANQVWSNLLEKDKHLAKLRLVAFCFISIVSLLGLIPAVQMLSSDFTKSGFYEYISLVSSDGSLLLSHWREFLLSIAESLPIPSLLLSLSLIFVFFLSVKYALGQKSRSQLSLSFRT